MKYLFTAFMLALAAPVTAQTPIIANHAVAERGVTLVMVEYEHCPFCKRWKAEVGPDYAASAQGRRAPLSMIDIDGPWPDGIVLSTRPYITPTFILLQDKQEVARIAGYTTPAAFYQGLDIMLEALR